MSASKSTRGALAAAVLITAVLYAVPQLNVLGSPLRWFSIFAHEMGHGLTAWALGGTFENFRLWSTSGVAQTSGDFGALQRAAVSAGGLLGPSMLSAVFFGSATRPRLARSFLGAFGVACLLADVLLVRNVFGLVFVAVLGLVCLAIAARTSARTAQFTVVFLGIQLALSVFSNRGYLFTDVANTGGGTMPSDVAQISLQLGGPYWMWGGIVGTLSVVILAVGLGNFLRRV